MADAPPPPPASSQQTGSTAGLSKSAKKKRRRKKDGINSNNASNPNPRSSGSGSGGDHSTDSGVSSDQPRKVRPGKEPAWPNGQYSSLQDFWDNLSDDVKEGLTRIHAGDLLHEIKTLKKQVCLCSSCNKQRNIFQVDMNNIFHEFLDNLRQIPPTEQLSDPSAPFDYSTTLVVKDQHIALRDEVRTNKGNRMLSMMAHMRESRERIEYEEVRRLPDTVVNALLGMEEFGPEASLHVADRRVLAKRMFHLIIAKKFELRIMAAYRDKIALEKQQLLIQEEEEEGRAQILKEQQREAAKLKKKQKKERQKQSQLEEKRRQEAEEAKVQEEKRLQLEREEEVKEVEREQRRQELAQEEAARMKAEKAETEKRKRREEARQAEAKVKEARKREERLKEERLKEEKLKKEMLKDEGIKEEFLKEEKRKQKEDASKQTQGKAKRREQKQVAKSPTHEKQSRNAKTKPVAARTKNTTEDVAGNTAVEGHSIEENSPKAVPKMLVNEPKANLVDSSTHVNGSGASLLDATSANSALSAQSASVPDIVSPTQPHDQPLVTGNTIAAQLPNLNAQHSPTGSSVGPSYHTIDSGFPSAGTAVPLDVASGYNASLVSHEVASGNSSPRVKMALAPGYVPQAPDGSRHMIAPMPQFEDQSMMGPSNGMLPIGIPSFAPRYMYPGQSAEMGSGVDNGPSFAAVGQVENFGPVAQNVHLNHNHVHAPVIGMAPQQTSSANDPVATLHPRGQISAIGSGRRVYDSYNEDDDILPEGSAGLRSPEPPNDSLTSWAQVVDSDSVLQQPPSQQPKLEASQSSASPQWGMVGFHDHVKLQQLQQLHGQPTSWQFGSVDHVEPVQDVWANTPAARQ